MEDFKAKYALETAKKRVAAIRCFYINLVAYIILIPVLIYINLTYTPDVYWFVYSILGWGTSLFILAMTAFDFTPFCGAEWRARKLKELIKEEERKQHISKTSQ